MPKTPRTRADYYAQGVRLSANDVAWLRHETEKTDPPRSVNEVAMEHLRDRVTLYGLPRDQVDRLLADAGEKGYWYPEREGRERRIDRRAYIQSVLSGAYSALIRESLDTSSGKFTVAPVAGEEAISDADAQTFSTSIRIPLDLAVWLKEETYFIGNWSDLVRAIFADYRLLFGLDLTHVRLLNGDAKRLGLSRRDYIRHALARRYEELMREDFRKEKEREEQHKKKK